MEETRDCLSCGHVNPADASHCEACGQELGVLGTLFERVTGSRSDWLQELREQAPTLKAQQEAVSQAQMAEMLAAEERRYAALAQARAERDRQQRILVGVTAAVCILLILIVIAVAVLGG